MTQIRQTYARNEDPHRLVVATEMSLTHLFTYQALRGLFRVEMTNCNQNYLCYTVMTHFLISRNFLYTSYGFFQTIILQSFLNHPISSLLVIR